MEERRGRGNKKRMKNRGKIREGLGGGGGSGGEAVKGRTDKGI